MEPLFVKGNIFTLARWLILPKDKVSSLYINYIVIIKKQRFKKIKKVLNCHIYVVFLKLNDNSYNQIVKESLESKSKLNKQIQFVISESWTLKRDESTNL